MDVLELHLKSIFLGAVKIILTDCYLVFNVVLNKASN